MLKTIEIVRIFEVDRKWQNSKNYNGVECRGQDEYKET